MGKRIAIVMLVAGGFCSEPLSTYAAERRNGKPRDNRNATGSRSPKRLLLIGQGPDGHGWGTHEYRAGMRILAQCLQPVPRLQTIVVSADGKWPEGPELIDGVDGVVLFVSEGAKWIHDDPRRLIALKNLANRGGGFVCWHWGMGCRDAKYIAEYVKLFGGCHGGPDRKYKVEKGVRAEVVGGTHPVVRGIKDFVVDEEFYYTLKFAKPAGSVTPLIRANVDGGRHTVCWAWERPDGGRSFGFSGGHYHNNWNRQEYRRLITQAVLWSVHAPIPEKRLLPLKVKQKDLTQPRPKPDKSE